MASYENYLLANYKTAEYQVDYLTNIARMKHHATLALARHDQTEHHLPFSEQKLKRSCRKVWETQTYQAIEKAIKLND
jgi:hypothetical protein